MYSFTSRVRYSEIDENAEMSITSLLNYLQDCSCFHSEELGIGVEWLNKHQLAWLLLLSDVHIYRMPRYGEEIRISTGVYSLKSFLASREFSVETLDGEPLVVADTQWACYDLANEKIISSPEEAKSYLASDERFDMPKLRRKIKLPAALTHAGSLRISSQELDTNHHVNNAQYIKIMLGFLSEKGINVAASELSRLSVHYIAQTHLHDTISCSFAEVDHSIFVRLQDEAEQDICVLQLERRS